MKYDENSKKNISICLSMTVLLMTVNIFDGMFYENNYCLTPWMCLFQYKNSPLDMSEWQMCNYH